MKPIDAEFFRSLEQSLQSPNVRQSREAMEALLAEIFLEFGSSGRIYDKAAVTAALTSESAHAELAVPAMLDFEVRPLAHEAVLVTYRSVAAGRTDVLRSSVWVRDNTSWRMAFHQGTPVSTPPSP